MAACRVPRACLPPPFYFKRKMDKEKFYEVDGGIVVEDMPSADAPADGGAEPRAGTAVGKKLRVCASKTRAQALSLTGANAEVLYFPTDADCIVFGGKEYGAQPYPGLLSVNGVDMGHLPGRIDFCAVCTSDAGASTKEISLTSKEGMSHANANFPRGLVVKFSKGNTYQGRSVYLDINGGEQKVRMGDARGFPFLPPGSSLFLACNGGIQWDIVGSSVAHYEIGDVVSVTSTPTSEQLDGLFGTHDGTLNHPLMLAIKGGCTIVSDSSFGKITVTGWTNGHMVGVNYNIMGSARCILATNSVSGWTSPSYLAYDLTKIQA